MSASGGKPSGESGPWSFGSKSGLRERLGTYFIGISLGLLLTGMIVMMRYRAAQREAARVQAEQAAQQPKP